MSNNLIAGATIDGKKISSPGHYQTAHISLFPHNPGDLKGGKIDIKEIVGRINIFESITQASIFVKLMVVDSGNLLETLRISGNEKIHIHLYQDIHIPAIRKEIDIEVYISDILNYAKPSVGAQTFEIQAVSKEALLNQWTTLCSEFNDSVTNLVEGICQSHLEVTQGEVNLAPTDANEKPGGGGQVKGIYPNLKPFKAINWLTRSALVDGSPFFFFDSLRKNETGVNKRQLQLHTYKELIKQPIIDTFNNIPFFQEKERTEEKFYTAQLRKIKKISSDLNISTFNNIAKGGYASTTISVDLSTKKYKEKEFKYEEKIKPEIIKDNRFFPSFNKKGFPEGGKDAKKIYVSENSQAYGEDTKNYHSTVKENAGEAQAWMVNAESTMHKLVLAGNPDLYAGGMIELDIAKAVDKEMAENEKSKSDEYMSGIYMIRNLEHKFDGQEYQTIVDVVKNSSKLDLESEVKIS